MDGLLVLSQEEDAYLKSYSKMKSIFSIQEIPAEWGSFSFHLRDLTLELLQTQATEEIWKTCSLAHKI
jgi:hypothetical protein